MAFARTQQRQPGVVATRSFAPGDPAADAVAAILDVLDVDRWTFEAFRGRGPEQYVVSSDGKPPPPASALVPHRHTPGARLAAIRGDLRPYAHGVALRFGDHRGAYAMLSLFRRAARGPFTATELRLLEFALATFSGRLSRARLVERFRLAQPPARAQKRWLLERTRGSVFYVVDRDLRIVLGPPPLGEPIGEAAPREERLPAGVERIVREMVRDWDEAGAPHGTVAQPAPFLIVRVEPLSGGSRDYLGVQLYGFGERDALRGGLIRFGITPREAQTLLLVMDGLTVGEMAERLSISVSTIQDHLKRLLEKTRTANRAAMVARVLGWRTHEADPDDPP